MQGIIDKKRTDFVIDIIEWALQKRVGHVVGGMEFSFLNKNRKALMDENVFLTWITSYVKI